MHIADDLNRSINTTALTKKARQCLHFLQRLRKVTSPPSIMTALYRGTIESILTHCITVWYRNCSAADRKSLQRKVRAAAKITGASLSHSFAVVPSGRRLQSIKTRSTRLCNSFFPPSDDNIAYTYGHKCTSTLHITRSTQNLTLHWFLPLYIAHDKASVLCLRLYFLNDALFTS